MLSLGLILTAIVLLMFSGFPAWLLAPRSLVGQWLAAGLMLVASVLGWVGVFLAAYAPSPVSMHASWYLPWGEFAVTLDPLSLLFLGLIFLVPVLGSIYGLGYWKHSKHPDNGARLALFYGLLAGAMALVVIARDSILFLIAWEIMAIAAFFAATTEEENPEVRRAGWVYLIATHVGTLFLLAMFALWRHATSSFALTTVAALPEKTATALFLLAVIGFGVKAGLMPLHLWLPGAHANAPSHVSAVMSGVMLKMGIYGILRMTALLPVHPVWWGGSLLTLGALTGLLGIAFAIGQSDIKRLLAYSSIENIGIILMGIGLAMLGRSVGQWDWVLLGLGGALLHVWNHGLFKSLLFLNAGAIIHTVHTRNLDLLGGLAKSMPRTMLLFLVGAVAICGLPPLNGFAGEWLLYLGLFRTLDPGSLPMLSAAAVAAVALAMIGALAIACFVKVFGVVFLGSRRSPASGLEQDPAMTLWGPMLVLALGCVAIGLFPTLLLPMVQNAIQTWAGSSQPLHSLASMAPWPWLLYLGLTLLFVIAGLAWAIQRSLRKRPARPTLTWDCGYAQPTARMQYTGSSLGQTLVRLFAFFLRPQAHTPSLRGLFPKSASSKTLVSDLVLDHWVAPWFSGIGRMLQRLRSLQPGQTHWYLLYILITTILLLLFWGMGVPA